MHQICCKYDLHLGKGKENFCLISNENKAGVSDMHIHLLCFI